MKKIVLLIALVFSLPAFSQGVSGGGVIVHLGSINEILLFRVSGNTESNRPACAITKRFAVHKDSVHAPLIMMAFANGKKLGSLRGFGTCSQHSNAEDLRWFEICPVTGC
ncbi:hypothetical protein [Aliiglaciecola sp. M165]|uniref:hypothetical protein n=1 Tax=Aliiglaciecola sp. M165 TaxID=2593649 RepID=UPI00117E7740|nr:hypothetical protein [Aliiglaciecola sp. M165]TRY28665.1 hypothetical protein FM019_20605 [Aliiglaciecola sp. M165]